MVPKAIRRRLARLRRREFLLRLTWGLARVLAVVLVLLALACLADWLIDRYQETPWQARAALLAVQALAAAGAGLFFLALPLLGRPGNNELALLVESKVPELGHRLISAVQLNRRGARTQGMSPELIARVTAEAEQQAARLRFTRVADHRRLAWSAALAVPLLLAGGLAFALWPETVTALVKRQLLADEEIPRSVYLAGLAPEVWYRPNNEEVVLRFRATGPAAGEAEEGQVRISPRGHEAEYYPLKREAVTGPGEAVYAARIPPSAVDFTYRAWLDDGRTPRPREVRYAPRPVVTEQQAWVLLPEFVGLKPKSRGRYEQEAARAEIVALAGSAARVRVTVQKPVREAVVETLCSPSLLVPETVRRRIRLGLEGEGRSAAGTFDLLADETAYRVVVKDEHGFENVPPPRRGIRIVPEDPPQVALLREEFRPGGRLAGLTGTAADFEVEGMPVPPGGRIRIAYACGGRYGVGAARLRFRVVKKKDKADDSGGESEREEAGPWHLLPLIEVQGSPEAGTFDVRRGVFVRSGDDEQLQFHAVPSRDPERVPGRLQGGGRFDFSTRGIPDGKGGLLDLQPGDQLEYYVEVFADRDPGAGRPSARSETRRKTVVTVTELVRWLDETLQEERRIRHLETKQQGVFDGD
jgi:hypothetical protein